MNSPRILIVEDEAITAADLKRQLIALGYGVAGLADNPHDALRLVAETSPDLVLMDITLAGEVDGITTALAIRGTSEIPVIFLTAHAENSTIERAAKAGAFGYLLKPFEKAKLHAAVEIALHKHRTEIESRVLKS